MSKRISVKASDLPGPSAKLETLKKYIGNLEAWAEKMGPQYWQDAESARKHDAFRRAVNREEGREVYPESGMHYPPDSYTRKAAELETGIRNLEAWAERVKPDDFWALDAENARKHDELRRKYNELMEAEIYPDGAMHDKQGAKVALVDGKRRLFVKASDLSVSTEGDDSALTTGEPSVKPPPQEGGSSPDANVQRNTGR